ncbi:MAG TPA: aminotransferase class V-fold PLP-dependent enzyme [Gammaproteobacteria bacterium]|nr:aminotransferase class V-fold PLP-dependent enzyme [Gammaproteobacteria bacterium]
MRASAERHSAVNWESVRSRFPAAIRCAYLNTAGGGPLSDAAYEAAQGYYRAVYGEGDLGWPDWQRRVEGIRAQAAAFLGASARDLAFVGNASAALNAVAELMPPGEVLTGAREFPSVTMPWIVRNRRVRFVDDAGDGVLTLEAVRAAMTKDTRVLALSHVQYASGARLDVEAIGALCLERGVKLVCDATQSFGAFPLDVRRIQPAALVFSGYKWACAGYGVAGLYLSPEMRDWKAPPLAGWRSAGSPYDLEARAPVFTTDARAMELGHPPVPGVFALGGALQVTTEVGIDRIAGRIHALVERLHAGLDERGFDIDSPRARDQRSGITMVPIDDPERARSHLEEREIFISIRGGKLRVSLHLFNSEADVDRLLGALDQMR